MSCRSALFAQCIAALVLLQAAAPVRAELADDVAQFISDRQALEAKIEEIAGDRNVMSADLGHGGDETVLISDVLDFLADRAEANALRVRMKAERKLIRKDLKYRPAAKIRKPTPPAGSLQQDAQSFIERYDEWESLRAKVDQDVADMKAALAAPVNSQKLADATTAFFNDGRKRIEARLQWQSDLRGLTKDVIARDKAKGKGKGKTKEKTKGPAGTSLNDYVAEFLADRAEWEALGASLAADRENIRQALANGTGLDDAVDAFLTDRRARRIKAEELALDRAAMRRDVGLSRNEKLYRKLGAPFAAKDEDADDENGGLEESPEVAGD